MTRAERRRFSSWLAKMGAELLPLHQSEEARFRGQDTLCIVYAVNRRGGRSCVPKLAREVWDAWEARRDIDLRNTVIDPDHAEPDWRTVGRAGCALAARVQAGDVVDLDEASAQIGIHPDRMARIATAHLLRVTDGKITRAAA